MRLAVFSIALLLCSVGLARAFEDTTLEDDDFAEFEQFEVEDEDPADGGDFVRVDKEIPEQKQKSASKEFESNGDTDADVMVEDEDNEFEHFHDPEEFEGIPDSAPPRSSEQPKITISKVPIMVRPRWDAYWLEGILCCLLAAYALAYAVGKSKNTSIAINFLKNHKALLDENFTLVGETGSDVVCIGEGRGWRREAEHCFTMWCSGRVCCEGMLLTLKLIKRQDLVHVLLGTVRPTPDTLQIKVELSKDDGDPFVLCVAQKKVATRLVKEWQDLSVFCPEKRAGEKYGLPPSLWVMSEVGEAASAVLDARVTQALHQHHAALQYLHVSDAHSQPVDDPAPTKPPETERVIQMGITLSGDGGGDEVRPLLQLVLHLVDKMRRLRLSKEALAKCEKRRQKAAEVWLRGAHAARQEQAAQRREEKRKQEKERILAEDDPEKQRRWELKEQKRQQKRKNPKMKQLKVKAL